MKIFSLSITGQQEINQGSDIVNIDITVSIDIGSWIDFTPHQQQVDKSRQVRNVHNAITIHVTGNGIFIALNMRKIAPAAYIASQLRGTSKVAEYK